MAVFDYLITVCNDNSKHHCKEGMEIGNILPNQRCATRNFDTITISFLYYNDLKDVLYEDDEYFILVKGTFTPDTDGKLPKIHEIASSLKLDESRIVPSLRGHFNIIKILKRSNVVWIINDYFGLKPK